MCGIAGSTGRDDGSRATVVDKQLATLRRRGPDSEGAFARCGLVVGQTRLAIIDVVGGDPPLSDESGEIGVALNGEIYNFRDLQKRLRRTGHTLASRCDTEVIAHLAEDLEPVALAQQLDGMFAFAIADSRRGRLILGRDRLGKKPLYYWYGGGELVFGSEIKAVLADPRVPRRLNEAAVPAYLAWGYAPSPETFFEGIQSLPPGCVLVLDEGGTPRIEQYWDATVPAEHEWLRGTSDELATELRRLLDAAVERRMVADVPIGAFLSGGLDSSAVVAMMAAHSARPVSTFCIGFEDPRYDERAWARLVAQEFGTDHHEQVVRPDASALLDEILTACDQPFADSSAIPTYLLAQMTRQHVTVALSGDGGDELFAGYERFAVAVGMSRVHGLPGTVRAPVGALGRRLRGSDLRGPGARAGRLLRAVGDGLPAGYLRLVQVFEPELLDALLLPHVLRPAVGTSAVWAASSGAPTLARVLDLNRRTYLHDDLLVKTDRMSMAHGLEVRSPLLDPKLLEFALRVPPDEHVRGRQLKRLLKLALRDVVPAAVIDRPKKGFGVPLDAWFRGELRAETRQRLTSSSSRLSRFLDVAVVTDAVDQHERGTAANGQRLWTLLCLERFLEREGW